MAGGYVCTLVMILVGVGVTVPLAAGMCIDVSMLNFCKEVNYKAFALDSFNPANDPMVADMFAQSLYETRVDDYDAVFKDNPTTRKACQKTFKTFLCSHFFHKCDDSGQPLLVCQDLCMAYKRDCGAPDVDCGDGSFAMGKCTSTDPQFRGSPLPASRAEFAPSLVRELNKCVKAAGEEGGGLPPTECTP